MTPEESPANIFFREVMHYIALATIWTVGQEKQEREVQKDTLYAIHFIIEDAEGIPCRKTSSFDEQLERLANSYSTPVANLIVGKHLRRLTRDESTEGSHRSLEDSLHLVKSGLAVLREPSEAQQQWYRQH